jgi:hypothetical protein
VTRCVSELALEAYLFDPARSRLGSHLEACGACRTRLARMEREGEEFHRFVQPRTVDRVVAARAAPGSRWRGWVATLLPAGGLAAAAAAAMLLLTPRPPADYVGAKGSALSMQVWAGSAEGALEVSDGERVPAAARLRFRVSSGRPCRLWLVSVDAGGELSRLFPAPGEAPATVTGGTTLPGGVALDGLPGPERLYAVCSPDVLPFEQVERSVRGALAGRTDALRSGPRLDGLPEDAAQATILLEKVP